MIKLPTKKKLHGLRFGQFFCIAMFQNLAYFVGEEDKVNELFYIENKDLEKKLNDYLEDYKNNLKK